MKAIGMEMAVFRWKAGRKSERKTRRRWRDGRQVDGGVKEG